MNPENTILTNKTEAKHAAKKEPFMNEYTTQQLLAMQPEELLPFCKTHADKLALPDEIDTPEGKRILQTQLNYTTAMIAYYKELEEIAKIEKRRIKREGCTREEADRSLAVEEIFAMYKSIFERYYENLAKMVTIKRMSIEEAKIMASQT